MFLFRLSPRCRSPLPPSAGFSLVELLLALTLGSVLIAAATSVAVSMIRSSVQDEAAQVAQNGWSRVQQFLLAEVGEAGRSYVASVESAPIELGFSTSSCSGLPAPPPQASFSLRVRNPARPGDPPSLIHFYNQGADLFRCGPPVLADGSLDFSRASTPAVLSYNTNLADVALGHAGRSLSYTVLIRTPAGQLLFSAPGRAWAQSALIEAEG